MQSESQIALTFGTLSGKLSSCKWRRRLEISERYTENEKAISRKVTIAMISDYVWMLQLDDPAREHNRACPTRNLHPR